MQHGGSLRGELDLEGVELRAVIAAALAAFLEREPELDASRTVAWANAAMHRGWEAGGRWPVGLVTWQQAEQPR